MDWIERLFHLAPDGGTGTLEVGIVAGIAVALAMMIAGAIRLRLGSKRLVRFRYLRSASSNRRG